MRAWTCCLLLALGACGLGDDVADGNRGQCAEGGALNDTCSRNVTTAEQACWRMVDCGALPSYAHDGDDWTDCVNAIDRMSTIESRLTIACVGASSCDALKLDSRQGLYKNACFAYGDN